MESMVIAWGGTRMYKENQDFELHEFALEPTSKNYLLTVTATWGILHLGSADLRGSWIELRRFVNLDKKKSIFTCSHL